MKNILFLSILMCLGLCAMAQEPVISGETKVVFSSISADKNTGKPERIHVDFDTMVLVYGTENKVQFSVDGVEAKQLIVKVVSEDLCKARKGEEFGQYYFTPTAKEGKVVIRIGQMDFMGAYMRIGEVEFDITE